MSKETVSLQFEEFQGCAHAHTHRLYSTDDIDRSIHGGTFQLSVGRKGKQRSDLGYRGWNRIVISFLVSFSFARGERMEGERGEGEGQISTCIHARGSRGSIEGDSGEGEEESRAKRGEMCPEAKFHLTQLRQARRLGRPLTSTVALRVDLART